MSPKRGATMGGIITPGGGPAGVITARGSLKLDSRVQKPIANYFDRALPDAGRNLRVVGFHAEYPHERHRPLGPSSMYNCHGLTFGARRTGITKHSDVTQILSEDGYTFLGNNPTVHAGDIAIYIANAQIEHSGIVVWVSRTNGEIWILSKWGEFHEVVHRPLNCPYQQCNVQYYRLES